MVYPICIPIIIENNVSKQCWPCSDAAFCGVWSGSALFVYVQQKHTRLICVKRPLDMIVMLKFDLLIFPLKHMLCILSVLPELDSSLEHTKTIVLTD